ncbi:4Fe-4S binding domain protein [Slackia exigua ATCC 700122]|uniref:4Fe-4S binding domain protein n=2 Tax=Slackia TaxID=84108 RepID=D0WIP0_SLAES|nr:4Fe-4S binding domain protein [Slackia exigua ATCC 700122]
MAKDTDTGIVSNDPDVCIGCGACAKACPYGAPAVVETLGIAKKCDMCKNLIDIGEAPACVEICPQRVLEYDTYDNLVAKHDGLKDVAPLPDSATTGPCVVITPHADAVYDSGQCRPMHLEEQ